MTSNSSVGFRTAVIGCGRMGAVTGEAMQKFAPTAWLPLSHADAVNSHSDLELIGLCDIAPDLLASACARFDGVSGFADYRDLLDTLYPEVITVATRTPERPQIIADAIAAGVRGLHLEKPLCNSVSQLNNLESLLAPPGIVCTFGTLRRYMPIYNRALELTSEKNFGTLNQLQINMGKAPLLWSHPHSLDLLMLFAGERKVESVSARFAPGSVQRQGSSLDGDPVVMSILVEFSGGVTGFIGQTGGCDVLLSGSNGLISIESDGRRLLFRDSDGGDPYWDRRRIEEPGGDGGGTGLALNRLVEGLKGNYIQTLFDKTAILMGQRLLLACGQSWLEGGAPIDPGNLDPDLIITGRTGNRYA